MLEIASKRLIRKFTKSLGDLPTLLITSFFKDTAKLYDVLGVQPGVGYFLNLGWWTDELKNAETIDKATIKEACRELVRQLASFGNLQPDDRILDVGFGFGQQDVLLADEFGCEDITGINITPYHVKKGRNLLKENSVDDRVSLHIGDAVQLPYSDDHFDTVFALESAFHFRTRRDFLKEARRVLKPGGKLLVADIIDGPKRSESDSRITSFLAEAHEHYWNIPSENRINRDGYKQQLRNEGFTDVTIRDVSDHVLEPWVNHYLSWRINQQTRPLRWLGQPLRKAIMRFYRSDYFSYVFVRAS